MHNLKQEAEENFDDDLLEGIIDSVEINPVSRLVKSEFEAWHLPRKQFVRIKQWVDLIERNKRKILADREQINYLSLPGDDLLDLRVIYDKFCVKNNVMFQFLGFNKYPREAKHPRTNDINLSLVEVKEKKLIVQKSKVINNDINQIGNARSSAYMAAKEYGPYDVINLDFCDSIFSKQSTSMDTHRLLYEIVYLQSVRRNPWLMFVTSRVGKKHIDQETLDKLMVCFQDNLKHPEFLDVANNKMGVKGFSDVVNSIKNHDSHVNITLISLLKWLLSSCLQLNPKVKIELSSTLTYVVDTNDEGVDIVSFALLFTPVESRASDKFSMVPDAHYSKLESEPSIASEFIDRVLNKKNCDTLLKENSELWSDMLSQTESLLSNARYDLSKYREWLEKHFTYPR